MAPEPDEVDADAIDPLLGQPRMVADPRISVTQAAVVLDKTPAQVYRTIQLGQLQRRGDPNTRYGIALSDVHELRDKGEPIPIRRAAQSLARSVSAILELVADGKLPLVPGTKSLVYPADVQAIAADVAGLPIRRPGGPSGHVDTAAAAKRLGLSESYVRQMAAAEKILGGFQDGQWWFDSAHIDMIHRARRARRLRAIPQKRA
ncbi:hypothetical protein EV643_103292 [Kribbella sp. VKM Ac-2527]|uniref:Uncharacterized protein n=1 Tax=Kribbella caucasensis TaxID=2512215 RepID=A0A4R6KK76_9ACTN|nr:hypothetical protein [Kribbella sp. VKM Ac-2527]TDO51553.1 hypothetical protein EV643_103292 [Kribbella sp. VKM Ac-2527]